MRTLSKIVKHCLPLIALILLVSPLSATEVEESNANDSQIEDNDKANPFSYWGRLQSHEANELGLTYDEDDVRFLDFKISVKYPIFHSNNPEEPYLGIFSFYPYLAFTGRFGQYISNRDSSPVISKRFNPEIFLRRWFKSDEDLQIYIDLAVFGHESNGQSIDSQTEYLKKRQDLEIQGEDPNFANDYISRGWDYWGITGGMTKIFSPKDPAIKKFKVKRYAYYEWQVGFRYFYDYGPLQKEAEEYNDWERNPEGKPRRYFDGLRYHADGDVIVLTSEWFPVLKRFDIPFLSVIGGLHLTTGYSNPFKYFTYQLEGGLKIAGLPCVAWYSNGYNSDLAQYYKRVERFGFKVKLHSF